MIWDFVEVFSTEYSSLPLGREVEFGIECIPSIVLVSKAPYRMAPAKLRELKV